VCQIQNDKSYVACDTSGSNWQSDPVIEIFTRGISTKSVSVTIWTVKLMRKNVISIYYENYAIRYISF